MSNSSKLKSRESSSAALKLRGAGDGIKTPGFKTERVPVPSSRKFTARLSKDHSTQLKLKKVLDDIEARHGTLQKAKSVAEITPTKSKLKVPKLKLHEATSAVTLLATPRPRLTDFNELTLLRSEERERRLSRLVYQKFIVFAWRRSKMRLVKMSESLKNRHEQVLQLEQQVGCLKNLTQSECLKRIEASNECLRLKNALDFMEKEKKSLGDDKKTLEEDIAKLQESLRQSEINLENEKNLVNSKNVAVNILNDELAKERYLIKNLQEEQDFIKNKIKTQETVIKTQQDTIEKLELSVRMLNEQLKNAQALKKAQMEDLNQLQEQYRIESSKNNSLNCELNQVYISREKTEDMVRNLERKLLQMEEEMKIVKAENKDLKVELGSDNKWWKSAKEFAAMSWAVLQNAAYIMLPAA